MKKYRIVTDRYSGFEAQVWRWWFPFWIQIGGCNTFKSIERAEALIEKDKRNKKVVKYL